MARGRNSHHVLPLFCDDLIASTVDMTPGCFGAYMRILCYAWTRGGVPNDEQACSRRHCEGAERAGSTPQTLG
jgi:uncharacterized protein YdaU (DUF1376 family)